MSDKSRLFILQCVANISHVLEPARRLWVKARTPGSFRTYKRMRDQAERSYERFSRG